MNKWISLLLALCMPTLAFGYELTKADFDLIQKVDSKNWKLFKKYSNQVSVEEHRYGGASEQTQLFYNCSNFLGQIHFQIDHTDFKERLKKIDKLTKEWPKQKRHGENWSKLGQLSVAYNLLLGNLLGIDMAINNYGFEATCLNMQNSFNDLLGYWDNFKQIDSDLGDWLSKQD